MRKLPPRDARGRFISAKKVKPKRDARGRFISAKKAKPKRDAFGRFARAETPPNPPPPRDARGRFLGAKKPPVTPHKTRGVDGRYQSAAAKARADLAASQPPLPPPEEVGARQWLRWVDQWTARDDSATRGLDESSAIEAVREALHTYSLDTPLVTVMTMLLEEQETSSAEITLDANAPLYQSKRIRPETLDAFMRALRHFVDDLGAIILSVAFYARNGQKDVIGARARRGRRPKKRKNPGKSRQLRRLPGETEQDRQKRLARNRKRDQRARDRAKKKGKDQ